MLGVCLGHQALAIAFGGSVTRAAQPMHGKTSSITHEGTHLFKGLTGQIEVGRYHSLIIPATDVPPGFVRSGWVTGEDTVMAVRHESQPTFGVQFHPESVLTPAGHRIFRTFWSTDVFADLLETLRRHEDLTSAERKAPWRAS
jgi:anthranilate synthase/aminodeoxychorismate synthase-like glutamine amidotransferase